MRKYRRLTWMDRLRIEALYNAGHTLRFVAGQLGFSVSTIHAEVKHGLYEHMGAELTKRPWRYSAQIAQDHADFQQSAKGVPVKLGHRYDYACSVAEQLRQGRSPDMIVGSLRKTGAWTVSTTTLYRYIDRGYIPGITSKQLHEKSRRKRTQKHICRAARPPKGQSIERRPFEVFARTTFGHWEMDSIIGKKDGKRQSLLVLTERLTRYELVFRVSAKNAKSTVRALDNALSKFPQGTFKTVTVDNGSEFQDCYGMEHDRQGNKRLTVYYCHPYTSCERGSNERQNRLLRRYFPKGRSMAKVTQKDCDRAADAINSMPRKLFDYRSSADLFADELAKLQLTP